MSAGRFIAVVGPSGVGKDSLMEGVVAVCPSISRARRVITRPSETGGEDFEGVSAAVFKARLAQGAFCLHWEAHGLSYGIPAEVCQVLESGQDVLANLSRGMLGAAMEAFPATLAVFVTANPSILARRLEGRGRENQADIARRLTRTAPTRPDGLAVIEIDNSAPLETSVARLVAALYPERG
jgi:ribose 1,5-bisphosphokinase